MAEPTKKNGRRPETGAATKNSIFEGNHSTLPTYVDTIPEDIRILRLVSALHDLYVYDNSGAEPLWSYSFEEIGACFEFLRHANLRQLQRALAEHNRREGGPVTLARVLPFPDGGGI